MSTGISQFDVPSAGRRRGWPRLWQTPAFVVGLVCLALVAGTATLRENPGRDFQQKLRHLREALQGERDLPDLQTVIEPLIDSADEWPRFRAECQFLVGSYFYRRGELDPATPDWFVRAGQHLGRALTLDSDSADLAMLFYRLGMSQYRQGKDAGPALNWVRQGLDLGAENQVGGYRFLAEAYLALPEPNLAAAFSANQRHLELANDHDPEAFGYARYLHADILQRLDRRSEALQELEQIESTVSASLLAKVRLLQALCSEAEGQWSSALGYWKDLEPLAGEVAGGKGRVHYCLGLALTHLEPVDEDAVALQWQQAVDAGGEAGQAAAIRLGHRFGTGERYDAVRSLRLWNSALGAIRVSGQYKNPYIDPTQLFELFDETCERLLVKRDFASAQSLATLVARVAPAGAAEEKLARTHLRWANDLSAQAKRTPQSSDTLLREARARFQDAGDSFKQASVSRDPSERNELIWQSAHCYLGARDYANAALALETFVAQALGDERRSQGHFALAEAYQAQAQKAKARAHFLKCIELNAPPYVHRALAKLAQIEIEARKLDSAREILQQILSRHTPDLERDILEQALYSLGNTLFILGDADEGAIRLREAVRRFPSNPNVWNARHKLAEHAWERAKQIVVADAPGGGDERRALAEAMLQKRRGYLLEAHDAYQNIASDLEELYYRQKSLPMDLVLLWRNSLFNVGGLKRDMGDVVEAMTYFHAVQRLYKGKAESLFAAQSIYSCWQVVGKSASLRLQFQPLVLESMRMALQDLDHIPKDHDEEIFLSGTNPRSREQWRQLLRYWESDLNEPAPRGNERAVTLPE